jgi:hypothetical protein
MAACNCVALTNVVVLADPFHLTADPLMNPLPVTARVKARPPAVAVDGAKAVIEGDGLLMVNGELLQVPPPGAGLETVTWAVPAEAISVTRMAACNCVALMNVVVLADPFHLTVDPLMNPLPLTASVKARPPAVAVDGAKAVIEGDGLAGALTVMAPPIPADVVAVPSSKAP